MSLNNPLSALNADWCSLYSVKEFHRDVDPDFVWQGPGWYVTDTDTLFVTPAGSGKYWFYVYNGRNPLEESRKQFERIAGANKHEVW